MAIDNEKSATATENAPSESPRSSKAENHSVEEAGAHTPLEGAPWMYKPIKLGPLTLPWFASPPSQLTFVALVCFLCPGMYNAVNGLGAGGTIKSKDIDNATVAIYATFAGVGFFAGSIANRIGLKLTLSFGGFGYFLYIGSILSYVHNGNVGFLIFAGALLGLCAGLLWTAQGAIMMSYPPEEHKGKYISWFWMIFNLGAVIGSLVPLGENMHKTAGNVSDGTYIAFLVLMACGFVLAWGLVDSRKVRRADGSHIVVMKHPTWKSEILGLFEVLRTDSYIILLFPMFFASNWFYTYHFNGVNLAKFDVRTRGLNNTLYYLCQIFGSYGFGYALDVKSISRPLKAKILMGVLFTLTMAIWGGGYAYQKGYTRATTDKDKGFTGMDFNDSGYVGPMFLYMFYGAYDAAWQTSVYWYVPNLHFPHLSSPHVLTLISQAHGRFNEQWP